MIDEKALTKKQIRKIVGCPGYVIDYLNDCGRLPKIQESSGRGYPVKYHRDCIKIVQAHLEKQSNGLEHEE